MRSKKLELLFIIVLLFISVFCYLFYQNSSLEVRNYSIVDNRLGSEINDFKIVQISDLHNVSSKILVEDLVSEIKNEKPDIIVFTGDLVDSKNTDIDGAISFIKKIKDVGSMYYVSGNHEASIDNYDELKEKLISNDVIILDNKVEVLDLDGIKVNLIGIDDPKMSFNPSMSDAELVEYNLSNMEYDVNSFTILLSHRPELFDVYVKYNIDLVLTGHAHGGQIRIPFAGGLIAPNQGWFPEYDSGSFHDKKTTMIVSRGIGNSIIPFRVNNRPELVVIDL
jgi:predicted MPP superfamily phosphohydrolase